VEILWTPGAKTVEKLRAKFFQAPDRPEDAPGSRGRAHLRDPLRLIVIGRISKIVIRI
jgi:hypothetical protein